MGRIVLVILAVAWNRVSNGLAANYTGNVSQDRPWDFPCTDPARERIPHLRLGTPLP